MPDEEFWIFGYGSLIWRPDFAYLERRSALLKNWIRRFYQGSTDHRGIPGQPGRVVTLLPSPGGVTSGVVFRLDQADAKKVRSYLDHREKGGYRFMELEVFLSDAGSVMAWVYIATPENQNYLGPAPIPDIAKQIKSSHGPSGSNRDYLLHLSQALDDLNFRDNHVDELIEALNRLEE